MLTMDVFNQDAFSAIEMTMAVDRAGYVPTTLQTIPGLVTQVSVSNPHVMIEARGMAPALIQTSARGAPPSQKGGEIRNIRDFRTRRWDRTSRITAEELQGIRAFGSTGELKTLQIEVARRAMRIKQDFAMTKEFWLLAMVQGYVYDADGTTIYDWATEFGQARQAEVGFDLANASPASGAVRQKCAQVRRAITRALQGLGGAGIDIVALCGDNFYDKLTSHPEVVQTFTNWSAAADLRNDLGNAWRAFRYGDINFINYRGTDDTTTVGIATDACKIFPTNAGIFQWVNAPSEKIDFINTPGLDMYSWVVPDRDRNMWVDIEFYSYPLAVCVQPSALASGRAGA